MRLTIVDACQRAGQGGSPTAVLDEIPSLTDAERRAVPVAAGTSHAVFVAAGNQLRFFTATGELPACGHGTVAALAVLAERAGSTRYETLLHAGGRTFHGEATGGDGRYDAVFDPGPVELSDLAQAEYAPILAALGVDALDARVASVGRPRLLVQVADRRILASLTPDMFRLRAECDRLGLLGCYVHSTPSPDGRAAARMFAPSIGVDEDIANANSTACLAAHLAGPLAVPAHFAGPLAVAADLAGPFAVAGAPLHVDMGDSLGRPATITASTRPGPAGPLVRVGGTATIR